jgi:hypothetical protein
MLLFIVAAAFVLAGCNKSTPSIEIPHIHGLGFSSDGRQLIVPAHDGLRVFADGVWSVPEVPAHDYMGYTPVDNGFYSSGHPHPSSGMVNPLGLVKSTDGGETLVQLGFEGESDFHLMAVGYENHAIYVLNPAPNSTLPAGLHYSLDDGKTWQTGAMQGLTARPFSLAAHPTEANTVAIATEGGLFLSTEYGNSFNQIGDVATVTAVAFDPNGTRLLFAFNRLLSYDPASEGITEVASPAVAADDAIGYIAVNPIEPEQIALATYNRDIYFSSDSGRTWQQIATDGKAQ